MNADLELQIAIRARLLATPAVLALVPAASILDRHARPAPSPSIILGESQAVDEDISLRRAVTRIYHTAHVWKREPSLEGVKAICGTIRGAIHSGRLGLAAGYHCADAYVSGIRTIRDPDGETSHGIVTIEALIHEVLP
ncbi:DUF3168 domain-containing protein [Frigidibacter oleivorans]|uniref:DUF3168 domain-containing protein n=1 Tax=Frigidibacter oleivorans TaxID=2487129 RepID=UPI000F8C8A47|nr:DUF3168 domain-containing protein [Frigidibacter oleivorans]